MTSNLDTLTTERQQAALGLERLRGELADLLQRSQAVAELVTVRRAEQRTAAIELERSGGKNNKELTQKVAALNEAVARGDALAELCREKQGEVEAGQARLTAALRDEAEARRQGEVAALQTECDAIVGEVEAAFEKLALLAGDLELSVFQLQRLDRDAAAAVVDRVAGTALAERLARTGAKAIVDAGGGSCGLGVPALVRDPALARFDATVTAEIVLRERAAAHAPEAA